MTARATVADFARAIDRVGAGTNLQKSRARTKTMARVLEDKI
jgi:hypothetical protein